MVFESFIQRRIAVADGLKPLVIGAFEEPEAHLHPQAHRAMLKLITSLDGQKIISTHSPHVARVADVHSVRSISRRPDGTAKCQAVPRLVAGVAAFSDTELVHVRRFVQRNNGEILFARVVIVFEGDTEDFALPVFAHSHWGKDHSFVGVSLAHSDGAGNGKHIIRILEYLGIPWVLLADGDNAGKAGVTGIEKAIGRNLTAAELVQFDNGANFERYILDDGYGSIIKAAIASHFGPDELTRCKKLWDGTKQKDGKARDYTSAGGENRLLYDFCTEHKGTIGEVIATAIVANAPQQNLGPIPSKIRDAFVCADNYLKP